MVTEKGSKNVYSVSTDSKEQITVLGCVSADGAFQKPLVLFPGVRPIFHFKGADPNNCNVGNTPNGWISSEAFFSWFTNLFIGEIRNVVEFPILVFMDGHSSHVNVAIAEFCRNNIILYCFPAHASHLIQPLDVSVYGPLKKSWNTALDNFKKDYGEQMNKTNFFKVFDPAWEEAKKKPENVISGFRKSGLVPFNPNALDFSKIIDEGESAKKFQRDTAFSSVDQRLGIMMCFKLFDKHISSEKLSMFKTRYAEGYDIEEKTDLGDMYNLYRSMRQLLDNPQGMDNEDELNGMTNEIREVTEEASPSSASHTVEIDIDDPSV